MTNWLILSAFLTGVGTSMHCIGMCGPLAMSLPFNAFASASQKSLGIILYNVGRVVSYALIGLLAGIAGRGVNWFGLTQVLSIVLGSIILVSVILPGLLANKKIAVPPFLQHFQIHSLQVLLKKQQVFWMLPVGILNGLLPCGIVYMAVAASLVAGTITKSVLFMTFFGIGTIPAMTLLVLAGQRMSPDIRTRFNRLIPIISVIIGIMLMLRGLNLNIPFVSPYQSPNLSGGNTIDCHTN